MKYGKWRRQKKVLDLIVLISCKDCNLFKSIAVNRTEADYIIDRLILLLYMEVHCLNCNEKLRTKILIGLSLVIKNLNL